MREKVTRFLIKRASGLDVYATAVNEICRTTTSMVSSLALLCCAQIGPMKWPKRLGHPDHRVYQVYRIVHRASTGQIQLEREWIVVVISGIGCVCCVFDID